MTHLRTLFLLLLVFGLAALPGCELVGNLSGGEPAATAPQESDGEEDGAGGEDGDGAGEDGDGAGEDEEDWGDEDDGDWGDEDEDDEVEQWAQGYVYDQLGLPEDEVAGLSEQCLGDYEEFFDEVVAFLVEVMEDAIDQWEEIEDEALDAGLSDDELNDIFEEFDNDLDEELAYLTWEAGLELDNILESCE